MDKNEQQRLESALNKTSPRLVLYMMSIVAFVVAASAASGYFKYKRHQQAQIQAEKDAKTEMTLIDFKRNWNARGEAGVMFFSKSDQTNRADAVAHYATHDPEVMERMRHIKLGEKRKVSEWKGIIADKDYRYVRNYSWSELER